MALLLWILSPLAYLYQLFFALVRFFKNPMALPNAFVISVGNLTVGGTGKTPFVQFLVPLLQKQFPNTPITILSRGYGGSLSKPGAKVTLQSLPEEVGEEPLLHKSKFPEVTVLIGANRKEVYTRFTTEPETKRIVILDDGFQHFAIQRDLDLVLLDSTCPLGNGWTLPLGILRETETALNRASAVIFTKGDPLNPLLTNSLEKRLQKRFPNIPQFFCDQSEPTFDFAFPTSASNPHPWEDKSSVACLATAVGNPKQVEATAKRVWKGSFAEPKIFRDHAFLSATDLKNIREQLPPRCWIVITEKDWIKWKKPWNEILSSSPNLDPQILVMKVSFVMREESQFLSFFHSAFSSF